MQYNLSQRSSFVQAQIDLGQLEDEPRLSHAGTDRNDGALQALDR